MVTSGKNVASTTLNLTLREEEGRRPWSLTVPDVVQREGSLVCRTNQPYLLLNTRDVMKPLSSSLNLTITTDAQVAQHFTLNVSLENNQVEWEMINGTR